MRCPIYVATLLGPLVLAASASAQPKPSKVCPGDLTLTIASDRMAYLTCERGLRVIEGAGTLFDISAQAEDPAAKGEDLGRVTISAQKLKALGYARVEFATPLIKGKSYVLSVQPEEIRAVTQTAGTTSTAVATPAVGWAALHVKFSTEPSALLIPAPGDESNRFRLASSVGIHPCAAGSQPHQPVIVERGALQGETLHASDLLRLSRLTLDETDTPTSACRTMRDVESGQPMFDPARIGSGIVELRDGAFHQGSAKLNIKGVFNIFGDELTVPDDKQTVTVGSVPKGKEDSIYYLKFAHEAIEDAGPGWTIDAKLAPVFNRVVAGFNPTLNVTADVGFGKTQSPNILKVGGGLTQIKQIGNPTLQAVRFTPTVSVEADRDFAKKLNLLVEPDVRFYMPWMNHGRAIGSRRKYVEHIQSLGPEAAADVDTESRQFYQLVGFSAITSVALEVGHVLRESTVKTEDKASSVIVPKHGIARLRAKVQGTLEVDRVSFVIGLTPRWLFATEKVGRVREEVDAESGENKTVAVLEGVDGAQTYLEVTLHVGLDRSGHIALTSTYKRGPTPPTFERANVVQTGLTIKY